MTTSAAGSHSHATTALDAAIAAEAARATAAEAALAARLTALEAAPVPSPVPPPSGTAFLGYPVSAARVITGGTDIELSRASFQGLGAVAVVISGAVGVYLHDLDIASCVGGIYLLGCSGRLRIEDIRARDIGDGSIGSGHSNVIQLNGSWDDGTGGIRRVSALGGLTEDMISIYQSGGIDAAHPLVIESCHLAGLLTTTPTAHAWQSGSGSGMMLGDSGGHDIVARDNTLLDTGQVGIGIPAGTGIHILDNVLYGHQRVGPPGSNVGIYTPYTPAAYVGGHEVARNRVFWRNAAGDQNSFWDGGASGPIAGLATNTWGDTSIDPATLAVVL